MASLRQRRPQDPTPLGEGTKPKAARKQPKEDTWVDTIIQMSPLFILLPLLYYVLYRQSSYTPYGSRQRGVEALDARFGEGRTAGHWDFGDGRATEVGSVWLQGCENCHWVNTNLGNGG